MATLKENFCTQIKQLVEEQRKDNYSMRKIKEQEERIELLKEFDEEYFDAIVEKFAEEFFDKWYAFIQGNYAHWIKHNTDLSKELPEPTDSQVAYLTVGFSKQGNGKSYVTYSYNLGDHSNCFYYNANYEHYTEIPKNSIAVKILTEKMIEALEKEGVEVERVSNKANMYKVFVK